MIEANLRLFRLMPFSLVLVQVTSVFGFIFATINTAMVPNYANIVDMHLVLLQVTTLFGFECATINIAMVPNYSNIVNITLVLLQITTLFGFIFATINAAMVPNYSNIMLMCHVLLKMNLLCCSIIAPLHLTSKLLIASIPTSNLPSLASALLIIPTPILFRNNRTTCTTVP